MFSLARSRFSCAFFGAPSLFAFLAAAFLLGLLLDGCGGHSSLRVLMRMLFTLAGRNFFVRDERVFHAGALQSAVNTAAAAQGRLIIKNNEMACGFIIGDFLYALKRDKGLLRKLNLVFLYFEYHFRRLAVIGQHHPYPQEGSHSEVCKDSHASKICNFPHSQEGLWERPAQGALYQSEA